MKMKSIIELSKKIMSSIENEKQQPVGPAQNKTLPPSDRVDNKDFTRPIENTQESYVAGIQRTQQKISDDPQHEIMNDFQEHNKVPVRTLCEDEQEGSKIKCKQGMSSKTDGGNESDKGSHSTLLGKCANEKQQPVGLAQNKTLPPSDRVDNKDFTRPVENTQESNVAGIQRTQKKISDDPQHESMNDFQEHDKVPVRTLCEDEQEGPEIKYKQGMSLRTDGGNESDKGSHSTLMGKCAMPSHRSSLELDDFQEKAHTGGEKKYREERIDETTVAPNLPVCDSKLPCDTELHSILEVEDFKGCHKATEVEIISDEKESNRTEEVEPTKGSRQILARTQRNKRNHKSKEIEIETTVLRRSARNHIPTDRLTVSWEPTDTSQAQKKHIFSAEKKKGNGKVQTKRRARNVKFTFNTLHNKSVRAAREGKKRVTRRKLKVYTKAERKGRRCKKKTVVNSLFSADMLEKALSEAYNDPCNSFNSLESGFLHATSSQECSPGTANFKCTLIHEKAGAQTEAHEKDKFSDMLTSPSSQWTDGEVATLRKAYNAVDPKSSHFWEEIAFQVGVKSNGECQSKWFSLVRTPKDRRRKPLKSRKENQPENETSSNGKMAGFSQKKGDASCASLRTKQWDEGEDDIFDSTPLRGVFAKKNLENVWDQNLTLLCDVGSPLSISSYSHNHDKEMEEIAPMPSPLRIRRGYKGYIKALSRGQKKVAGKKKERKAGKCNSKGIRADRSLSAVVGAGDVQMNGVLSPGGTVRVQAPSDSDLEDLVIQPGEELSDDEDDVERENARLKLE